MNLLKKGLAFAALVVAIGSISVSEVKAEEVDYGISDVDRIYIQCDTPIKELIKDDVVDKNTGEVTKKAYQTATITVVAKDGTVQISDDAASVKLRGNSTSKAEKKPLKIKFNKKQVLLGMDKAKKWNVLANAFDKSLIRNKLCFDLADKLGLAYTSQCEFVDLYYNGVLQGSYLVTESVEAGEGQVEIAGNGDEEDTTSDFMIERENERYEEDVTYVTSKENVRFAINVPEVPSNEQLSGIQNWVNKVEAAFKTGDYAEYSKYVDVDSFVNYYILSEIFKAVDFNYSSTRFYVKDGIMYAGPIWDVDLSSGNASARFYTGYDNNGKSYEKLFCTEFKWYGYLIKSDVFVSRVNKRFAQIKPLVESLYKSSNGTASQIDMLLDKYGASFERNYASVEAGGAGWSVTYRYSLCDNRIGLEYDNPADTYKGNVELLRTWLSKRVPYLEKTWKEIKNNKISYLTATKSSTTKVKLQWRKIGVANGYEVSVQAPGGKYKVVATPGKDATSYVVSGLKAGAKYKFRVRSFVKDGTSKIYSDYRDAEYTIPLANPKYKASIKGNNLTIKWKKVALATGYEVYVKAGKNGKYKKVATTKNNKTLKYVYKKAKKKVPYYVKVKSYVKINGKKYYGK